MSTFAQVMSRRLADDPGGPLITFYDLTTGERTELSGTTYANWVAKLAGLLEETGLERGERLTVELPAHWLGAVTLGAAWTLGIAVVLDDSGDAVVCGPETVGPAAERASGRPVLASALLPLAVRFPEGLPGGVLDIGVEIWGQPDGFVPVDPAVETDLALAGRTQQQVWAEVPAGPVRRRLVTESPVEQPEPFVQALRDGGSVVLVVGATDPGDLDRIAQQERAEP